MRIHRMSLRLQADKRHNLFTGRLINHQIVSIAVHCQAMTIDLIAQADRARPVRKSIIYPDIAGAFR